MMWLWLLGCFSSEPEVALSPPWNEFGFKVGDGELGRHGKWPSAIGALRNASRCGRLVP